MLVIINLFETIFLVFSIYIDSLIKEDDYY